MHIGEVATNAQVSVAAKMEQLTRIRAALAQYASACRAREALAECPLLVSLGRLED